MDSDARATLCFGHFRLDLHRGHLWCGGQDVTLRPKAWDVLCYLAARPGEIVSIDELLDGCWKGLHVGPHAVTNVIYELRSVLTAAGGEHRAELVDDVGHRVGPDVQALPAAVQ